MHGYLATVCRDCGCEAYRVGGPADHIHIAARLSRTVTQAELLEKIKKTSSAWIKNQGEAYHSFHWQGGYGDFSIGWSQLEDLVKYIDHQEEHHRTRTFQEECRDYRAIPCGSPREVCLRLRKRRGLALVEREEDESRLQR